MNPNNLKLNNEFEALITDLDVQVELFLLQNNNWIDQISVDNINLLRDEYIKEIRGCEAFNMSFVKDEHQGIDLSFEFLFKKFCFLVESAKNRFKSGHFRWRLVITDRYLTRAQIKCFQEILKFVSCDMCDFEKMIARKSLNTLFTNIRIDQNWPEGFLFISFMVKYNSEVLESLVDINSNSLEIIRATSDQLFSFNEASFNFFFDSIQPDAEFLFARVRKLKITSQSHIYDRSNPITTRNIEAMIGLFEHIIVGDEKLECVALELEAYESSDPLPSLLLLCGSQSRLNDLNISIFQLSDFSKFQDSIFTENSPVSIIKNLAFHYNRVGFVDRKLFSLFPNLERLDLARNKIKILGKDVFRSAGSLTRLDLSKNEIDCLSEDSFQGLDNLKVLKVKAKSVDRRAFIHLLRLECLELCESPLKSIESDTFVDLPKLKKLNLASCSINSIDSRAFDNLSSLEELNISDNNLKIFETKSPVRILNASDNKNLALVKLNGDNESKVEVVQLLNNSIGTDLVSFFPMSQLQMLVITPTDEIRFDQFTCLEKLVLLLEDLGMLKRDQFNSLTNLKTLILRSSFSDKKVEQTIDGRVFAGLVSLANLVIKDFRYLRRISSDTFGSLTNVETLDLGSNAISLIETGAFSRLPKLERLNMANNQLEKFHLLNELVSLKCLNLQGNRFDSVNSVFQETATNYVNTNLGVLYLNKNQIKSLEANAFASLPSLVTLVLSENSITEMSSNAFNGLFNLRALDLSYNSFQTIDLSVFNCDLVNLRALNLTSKCLNCIRSTVDSKKVFSQYRDPVVFHVKNSILKECAVLDELVESGLVYLV